MKPVRNNNGEIIGEIVGQTKLPNGKTRVHVKLNERGEAEAAAGALRDGKMRVSYVQRKREP